jgi:hypothetical protein
MNEKHKISINDLIDQLYNHPDFLVGDFYTLSECIDDSNEFFEYEIENYNPVKTEEIDDELNLKIQEYLKHQLYLIFKYSDSPYPLIKRDELTGEIRID